MLETGQQVEGQLAQKQASLAASRAEFEDKQAEVGPLHASAECHRMIGNDLISQTGLFGVVLAVDRRPGVMLANARK